MLAEDKLFATLDPTARALLLPDYRSVMLIDTVGLVRRLPHHFVEAFKSTLEEAAQADLLLNVCDISSEEMAEQVEVTSSCWGIGGGGYAGPHRPSTSVIRWPSSPSPWGVHGG